MKRRSFLAALFAAPTVAKTSIFATAAVPVPAERRLPVGIQLARIGLVNAGVMKSSNGRMVVDFGAGCITLT
jgi:hypothetical protein